MHPKHSENPIFNVSVLGHGKKLGGWPPDHVASPGKKVLVVFFCINNCLPPFHEGMQRLAWPRLGPGILLSLPGASPACAGGASWVQQRAIHWASGGCTGRFCCIRISFFPEGAFLRVFYQFQQKVLPTRFSQDQLHSQEASHIICNVLRQRL